MTEVVFAIRPPLNALLTRARVELPAVAPFTMPRAVIVVASVMGAACTEWVETAPAMTVVVSVTPRRAKMPRSFPSARVTRTRAASSLTPVARPTSARVLFSKNRSTTAVRSRSPRASIAGSSKGAICRQAFSVSGSFSNDCM